MYEKVDVIGHHDVTTNQDVSLTGQIAKMTKGIVHSRICRSWLQQVRK